MSNANYDQLNARLRKRLAQLRQHQDPEEKFRLLKRYLSHFVKLVQIGRHFEASFAEHLRLVVACLNDRREKPLETDVLGTIVKTLCVICCVTAAPYQTVVIALQGLLEIFERISCKETLNVILYCGNHFKKLIAQSRRFGYFKIQLQLVELVYVSSLSFSDSNGRKDFVLELGRQIGGPLEQILNWKSFAVEQECRAFINGMQDKFPLFAPYSVPVEDCQIGEYRFTKPKDSCGLWLDVNFQPATIRFSACVTLIRGKDRLEMTANLEICHRDVSRIDVKEETDSRLLTIEYTKITIEPEVLTVDQKGSLTLSVLPSFDCSYLTNEVLPEVRLNVDRVEDSEQPCTTNLDGLLNMSLLDSVVSGTENSLNAHNLEDQSPRIRDNRDAIEKHRNIRCQMLDNTSSIGSNKENVEPSSVSDVRVVVQDVQRLRVFESLQQDCQLQQQRLSRSSKRNSSENHNRQDEKVDLNEGKKRKLFDKQVAQDDLNVSKDSQIQRSKYVEKKLVNTVKPMDVKPLSLGLNTGEDRVELLNESSASEMMSNDEFDRTLQTYIDVNGIFGIAQQKILGTKLEKNIRKINQMVERSTKRFFKREPAPENPYDFVESEGNRAKKQTVRKGGNSAVKGKRKSPKTKDENVSSAKKAKNVANQSLRNKNTKSAKATPGGKGQKRTPPKVADPVAPSRASLPRAKKPVLIIDLASDSEEEAVEIGNTFQNLDISSIVRDQHKPKNPIAKQLLFAKSTPVEGAKSKKRLIDQTFAVDELQQQHQQQQIDSRTFLAKNKCVPLVENNASSSSIVVRRDYKKRIIQNPLQEMATTLIEREKEKAQSSQTSSIISDRSVDTKISMEFLSAHSQSRKEPSTLTEALIRQHQTTSSDASISQSLEVNPSPIPIPAVETQLKPNGDTYVSKFNMKYAQNRYTLKKFISSNDQTYNSVDEAAPAHLETKLPNEGNESVLSDEIRVGCDAAHPPSLRDDLSDLQTDACVMLEEIQFPSYPTTPKVQTVRVDRNDQKERKDPKTRGNPSKHTSSGGAGSQNKTRGSIVPTNLFNRPPSMDAMMIDEFKTKLHQELNPSLADFEHKVHKLERIMTAFEPDLSELHIKEINQKCVEIMSLEDRLDELFNELATLCTDTMEKSDQATASANKLARYAESKGNYFKDLVKAAHCEIPGIVDECVKSVWNQQVQIRLNQVELLMTKMLM